MIHLTLALVLLALSAAPAQDDCGACEGRGLIACVTCAKKSCPDDVALHCTAAADCRKCGGIRVRECRKCDVSPEPSIAERTARTAAWRARLAPIDEFMERPLLHAESAHFLLTYDVKKLEAGRARLDGHAGMHLYLKRLEEFYARFKRDLAAQDEDFFEKTHVLIWKKQKDQERASTKYTRQTSSTQSKLMGAAPVVSIFYDKSHLHEEFELHQAVVHQVAHCLLSNVFDGIWPGNIKGGWIDGGLAHDYEVKLFDGVRHYCYVEADTLYTFKFGRWEGAVRAAVDRGKELPLLSVTGRHTSELTPEEHMFAWSYVDFLLREHPAEFPEIVKAVKRKESAAEAVRAVLGKSLFALEEEWRAFVKRHYSLKPKPKR